LTVAGFLVSIQLGGCVPFDIVSGMCDKSEISQGYRLAEERDS